MEKDSLNSKRIPLNEKHIVDTILTEEISKEGIEKIVEALEIKKYIVSAVIRETPESETLAHFLDRFWDYNKSPYVREKMVVGQSIHRRYVKIMHNRAMSYWAPLLGNKPLGSITRQDIKKCMWHFATLPQMIRTRKKDSEGKWIYVEKMISPETVNQAVRSATCALKWAFYNGLTKNDCFSGLIYCHVTPQRRMIPTLKQATKIFSTKWEHETYRVANLTSMCTGMRIGEIQALQIQDLGRDRIYVRHNWARNDGLKAPKNGCIREIKVPHELLTLLWKQAEQNPFGNNPDDFIFYGFTRNIPCGCRHWNEELHKIIRKLKIPNGNKITFHCWRHFFTTTMADYVDQRKLQLVTGHKSIQMLEHYAAHESEETLNELGEKAESIFLPIISSKIKKTLYHYRA